MCKHLGIKREILDPRVRMNKCTLEFLCNLFASQDGTWWCIWLLISTGWSRDGVNVLFIFVTPVVGKIGTSYSIKD